MIPFSPPKIDQKIIDEVTDTLKSGWITTGPKTKKFEEKIAEFVGIKKVLCVNSATAGLEMMLRWFGVGPGDEVITSAYTYAASVNVIEHVGATPVLVDVKDDFNIDPEKIKAKITDRTKVIIPVDIAGYPCDYDQIMDIVYEYRNLFKPSGEIQQQLNRILVLADAAHSIGAIYKDNKVGSQADITVFSFHAVKNLTTAEGGAVCFKLNDDFNIDSLYKDLCVFHLHGQTKDALTKIQGNWRYDIVNAGYKWNMTDVLASIGLVEIERYEAETLVKRRELFDFYNDYFSQYSLYKIPPFTSKDKTSSYHAFLLRINNINEKSRDAIIEKIFSQGVSVNVHFVPIPLFTYYRNRGFEINDYPTAYLNYSQEISLPVYYDLTIEDAKIVADSVHHSVLDIVGEDYAKVV